MELQLNEACIAEFIENQKSPYERVWWGIILLGFSAQSYMIDRTDLARTLNMDVILVEQAIRFFLSEGFMIEINPSVNSVEDLTTRIQSLSNIADFITLKNNDLNENFNGRKEAECTSGLNSISIPSRSIDYPVEP